MKFKLFQTALHDLTVIIPIAYNSLTNKYIVKNKYGTSPNIREIDESQILPIKPISKTNIL